MKEKDQELQTRSNSLLESIKKIEQDTKEAIRFKDQLEQVSKSVQEKKLKIIMLRKKIEEMQKTFDMT